MKKTNIDRAVEYIAAHPGCRSPEIEAAIGAANIAANLTPLIDAGFLIACLIERPGKRASYEFRLGAAVSPGMTWAEFRGATGPKKRAGLNVATRPMRATNPTPVVSKAKESLPPPELSKEEKVFRTLQEHVPAAAQAFKDGKTIQPDPVMQKPMFPNIEPHHIAPKKTSAPRLIGPVSNLNISIDNNARLHISTGEDYLELTPENARSLANFLKATEAVWTAA